MSQKYSRSITNKDIAHLLRSVAAAYLIKNENRFRIIAYQNAADSVEHLAREIRDVWQEGKLDKIPGIGQIIASSLDEYFRKGRSKHFEEVFKGIPMSVFELMKVPSIGPKKAFKLVQTFKLISKKTVFRDLKKLAEKGEIARIPKFGQKSQDVILHVLSLYESKERQIERMPLMYASEVAGEIIKYLIKHRFVKRADSLGSLRRKVSTIGDVDVAVSVDKESHIKEVMEHFLNYPKRVAVDNAGGKKASIIIFPQVRIDLRIQEEKSYGAMLQYFTGSKAHNVRLRERALTKGLSLSEYGIKELKNKHLHEFKTEEEFYGFLKLQWIPPEIREDMGEIELAKSHDLPLLVEAKHMKGDLHIHSSYDLKPSHDKGLDGYLELYKKAIKLGYQYMGFSDHNPKLSGLTPQQIVGILEKRKKHIANKFLKDKRLRYYIGLEVDILPNGSLAVPKEGLQHLDYMIVSVHSAFNLGVSAMTKRVIHALDNPKVKILAHPTSRLISRRDGYELDWEKIFTFCKARNIALEINAWPERLDLPDILVKEAVENKVKLVINSDSHALAHMDNLPYGVAVARRGWATQDDIINTRDYEQFNKWIRS